MKTILLAHFFLVLTDKSYSSEAIGLAYLQSQAIRWLSIISANFPSRPNLVTKFNKDCVNSSNTEELRQCFIETLHPIDLSACEACTELFANLGVFRFFTVDQCTVQVNEKIFHSQFYFLNNKIASLKAGNVILYRCPRGWDPTTICIMYYCPATNYVKSYENGKTVMAVNLNLIGDEYKYDYFFYYLCEERYEIVESKTVLMEGCTGLTPIR